MSDDDTGREANRFIDPLASDNIEISFKWVVPILRIFDIAKANEFYGGFLGFQVDSDHRIDPDSPLYRQISRGNLILASERASWGRLPRRSHSRNDAGHRSIIARSPQKDTGTCDLDSNAPRGDTRKRA
jgi:hypothetical protein